MLDTLSFLVKPNDYENQQTFPTKISFSREDKHDTLRNKNMKVGEINNVVN